MGTQAAILTPGQMRCIYALAREAGMDTEALHAVVENATGKTSIKTLTVSDAKQTIDALKRLTGQETTGPYDRPTKEQVAKIYGLARDLGWGDDPTRLRGFLEKRYGTSAPQWLNEKQVRACIVAMKSMVKGKRGERKGGRHGEMDGRADN